MAVGEIKVTDLPKMSAADFTANDFIFIVDNGESAKLISRPVSVYNIEVTISKLI